MQRRNPKEMNFGGLEMEKWNITPNNAQNDEKNEFICLAIMFTHGVGHCLWQ